MMEPTTAVDTVCEIKQRTAVGGHDYDVHRLTEKDLNRKS